MLDTLMMLWQLLVENVALPLNGETE